MNPLYIEIGMILIKNNPLSEDLNQIIDDDLRNFMQNNGIVDYLYKNNIITWQGDLLVLKDTKNKKENGTKNYWDELTAILKINGMSVTEFNSKHSGRFKASAATSNLVEKLLKKGFTYQTIKIVIEAETAKRFAEGKPHLICHIDKYLVYDSFKDSLKMLDYEKQTTIETSWS